MTENKAIRHIKSNIVYTIKGSIKAKIDGHWVNLILYENDAGEQFARDESDFDGFVDATPFSDSLSAHLESQGCLQINTTERLSLGAKSLLDESLSLLGEGRLVEITGIHKIRTFQKAT